MAQNRLLCQIEVILPPATRFGTASEMDEALYACLITKGEAFYSAFISYRVASEAPLARLLFDELNHRLLFILEFFFGFL